MSSPYLFVAFLSDLEKYSPHKIDPSILEDADQVKYLGQISFEDLSQYFDCPENAARAVAQVLQGLIGDWRLDDLGTLQDVIVDLQGLAIKHIRLSDYVYFSCETISGYHYKYDKDPTTIEPLYQILCYAGGLADRLGSSAFEKDLEKRTVPAQITKMVNTMTGCLYPGRGGRQSLAYSIPTEDRTSVYMAWYREMFRFALKGLDTRYRTPAKLLKWVQEDFDKRLACVPKIHRRRLLMSLSEAGNKIDERAVGMLLLPSASKYVIRLLESYHYHRILPTDKLKMVSVEKKGLQWSEDGALDINLGDKTLRIQISEGNMALSDAEKAQVARAVLLS